MTRSAFQSIPKTNCVQGTTLWLIHLHKGRARAFILFHPFVRTLGYALANFQSLASRDFGCFCLIPKCPKFGGTIQASFQAFRSQAEAAEVPGPQVLRELPPVHHLFQSVTLETVELPGSSIVGTRESPSLRGTSQTIEPCVQGGYTKRHGRSHSNIVPRTVAPPATQHTN